MYDPEDLNDSDNPFLLVVANSFVEMDYIRFEKNVNSAGNEISGSVAKGILNQVANKKFMKKLGDVLAQVPNREHTKVVVPSKTTDSYCLSRLFAQKVTKAFDLDLDDKIVRALSDNKMTHYDPGIERLLNKPVFEGDVQQGASYIIADDTVRTGGKAKALKNYIESRGGKVFCTVALSTPEGRDMDMSVSQQAVDSIKNKVARKSGLIRKRAIDNLRTHGIVLEGCTLQQLVHLNRGHVMPALVDLSRAPRENDIKSKVHKINCTFA